MKLNIQYSGLFNSVTLPESRSAELLHQACTLAKISLASMDMRRAMYLKGLPALHADVKALRQLTPGDQESIDPWHFGFPEDGTQELDDVLRQCDEAMQNGDDLTNIRRRLLEAFCKTDDYIRGWLWSSCWATRVRLINDIQRIPQQNGGRQGTAADCCREVHSGTNGEVRWHSVRDLRQ